MAPLDVSIWMKLMTGDFIKSTMSLSASQTGALIMLQVYYWSKLGKPIPNDDKLLAKITKQSLRQCKSMKLVVLEQYFELTDEGWKSAYLDALLAEAKDNRAKSRSKASHAATIRWERERANKKAGQSADVLDFKLSEDA